MLLLAAAAALVCGCSDAPLAPAAPAWVKQADVPGDVANVYGVFGATDDGHAKVLMAGDNETGKAVILSYNDKSIVQEYESPYPNSTFEAVTQGMSWAVAAGSKGAGGRKPYLVEYDAEKNAWGEKNLPDLPYRTISGLSLDASGGNYYFLLSNHTREFYGKHAGTLALYNGDEVTLFDSLGPVTAVSKFIFDTPCIVAVEYVGDYVEPKTPGGWEPPHYQDRGKVYISEDSGASWTTELLPAAFGPRRVLWAEALVAVDNGVFLKVLFDDNAVGLVRRTGPVGHGQYELVFLSYQGPYFHDLRAVAFAGHDEPLGMFSDGIGVGEFTTILYRAGDWFVEQLPYPMSFVDVDRAQGGGYAAVARNDVFGGYELLYHP